MCETGFKRGTHLQHKQKNKHNNLVHGEHSCSIGISTNAQSYGYAYVDVMLNKEMVVISSIVLADCLKVFHLCLYLCLCQQNPN